MGRQVLELQGLRINSGMMDSGDGSDVLESIIGLAAGTLDQLRSAVTVAGRPLAAVGRLRGTGRGIHFRDLIHTLERARPIELQAPFEGSDLVAGAAWPTVAVASGKLGALAKLRWNRGADDLPMHVHEHSDRFIIVHEGRGFFHVSGQSLGEFDGSSVRTVPARERDVFVFTRGIVHTFSTLDEPMTLLSCQMPFLEFDDPRQYTLPCHRWTARENPEPLPPSVGCDPAWTVLT